MAAVVAAVVAGGPMAAAAQAPQGMPVEAAPAQTETMTDELLVVGSLLANESTVIRPEIDGRVARIEFEEGGPAKKGDLLVKLDDASLRAELARAEANLALSRRNFDRADELYRRQNLPASSRDEALAKLRADEAAVRIAEVALEKTELRAPSTACSACARPAPATTCSRARPLSGWTTSTPSRSTSGCPRSSPTA